MPARSFFEFLAFGDATRAIEGRPGFSFRLHCKFHKSASLCLLDDVDRLDGGQFRAWDRLVPFIFSGHFSRRAPLRYRKMLCLQQDMRSFQFHGSPVDQSDSGKRNDGRRGIYCLQIFYPLRQRDDQNQTIPAAWSSVLSTQSYHNSNALFAQK